MSPEDQGRLLDRATLYAAQAMRLEPGGTDNDVRVRDWAETAIASAFVIGYNAALADMPRGRR